ncbi:class Ib ribonucleoside-diphosphate reductase assembly flavoprotein NrdI [Enterococcus mundtii]|uniref:class Ib ribonucleoside-diphosphate reductase assembly flavoprotein NrdI n=1 Tax=Enterococcus mundtii TaxID=53346 RepID=UPI001A96AFCE|nr:class Ib ribonucleoside-diphosphate reductase assembly flavoprotein NrdI [Enterococcus mundtii]MBO1087213.1 class Ib ribonucleoside-diphosphate reductase assembly flavoprotein NrdI [Enterococcus mundtii]
MLIVYLSLTGNTKRFVNKLGMDSLELNPTNPFIPVNEPYVIVAPTYELEATDCINDFIEHETNKAYLKGFLGGGNLNFGELFVFTAKDLSKEYSKPLLYSFEYSGTEVDINNVKDILLNIK